MTYVNKNSSKRWALVATGVTFAIAIASLWPRATNADVVAGDRKQANTDKLKTVAVLRDEDYQIKYENNFESFGGPSLLAIGPSKYKMQIAGVLSVRQIDQAGGSYWVQWADVDLYYFAGGQFNAEASQQICDELAAGFGLELNLERDQTGDHTTLRVSPPSSAWGKIAEGIGIELVTALARPATLDAGTSAMSAQDALGRYTVKLGLDSRAATLTKFGKTYASASRADINTNHRPLAPRPEATGTVTFRHWSTNGDFATAEISQAIELRDNDHVLLHATTVATASHLSRSSIGKNVAKQKPKTISLVQFNKIGADDQAPIPPAKEILSKLARLADINDAPERTRVVRNAGRLLRRSPAELPTVLALLATHDPGSQTYSGALRALLYAGTPEVQAALLYYIDNAAADGRSCAMLVAHLSEFSDPTPELLAALKRYASTAGGGEVADNATLALGTLASHLATAEDPRDTEIVNTLITRYQGTTAVGAKSLLWGALGNTGSVAILSIAESEYLSGPAELHPRIITALRLIPGAEAQGLILNAIAQGDTESTRAAGVSALSYRQPSPATVLACITALSTESSDSVLTGLVSYLSRNRAQYPEAGLAVDAALVQHPNIRV